MNPLCMTRTSTANPSPDEVRTPLFLRSCHLSQLLRLSVPTKRPPPDYLWQRTFLLDVSVKPKAYR